MGLEWGGYRLFSRNGADKDGSDRLHELDARGDLLSIYRGGGVSGGGVSEGGASGGGVSGGRGENGEKVGRYWSWGNRWELMEMGVLAKQVGRRG